MFKTLNHIVISLISKVPKTIIKKFANQYVAGITIGDVLDKVQNLNDLGLCATVDILGEHTKEILETQKITNDYCDILTEIDKRKLNCNISIKPSHIGTDISNKLFTDNLNMIQKTANSYNNFVRIDMENSKLTNISLKTYQLSLQTSNNIGIVLQAYLHRTYDDLNKLDSNSNIRICKGIYNESEKISFKKKEEINKNYIRLLKLALSKKIYVGIATHDPLLISQSLKIIKSMNITDEMFEFQMLYGVPMKKYINRILDYKYKIRIYVPFGPNWYDYSIRRIKENPNISKYVIQNLFKK